MKYTIPDFNTVMGQVPTQESNHNEEQLIEQGKLLIHLLDSFGISAQVSTISPGPVVTRYELKLEPGTKANSIEKLSVDLAMGLKAKSIRVVPISERSVIGIEIPNENPHIVYLRDILNSSQFMNDEQGINIVLGCDIAGNPVLTDLAKAPHMIVAGQTGAGKSIGINTFLMSILASKTPEELRLILIDPKIVELSPYNSIPHLLTPVVSDAKKAIRILDCVTKEMDARYVKLGNVKVRNIAGYNKKSAERMPFIVVIIDEMADLMMTAGKQAEKQIVRIAQKARAVGIHLILTTQRPSVNVITGLIKANVPTRVGFQTASQIDSRIIMDKNGCESLLGRGDMLVQDVADPDIHRVHGAYVDYIDVDNMVEACSQYPAEHIKFEDDEIKITINCNNILTNKLINSAIRLLDDGVDPSTALFQRKLNISYKMADKLLSELVKTGAIE